MTFRHLLYLLLLFVWCISCKQRTESKHGNKLKIVTTTAHIGDLIKNITKDKAEVVSLMGPGVDPHLYKASLSDLKELSSADIIFFGGLHLEGKMVEIFHKLDRSQKVVALSDSLPPSSIMFVDADRRTPDPHIWFDVTLWRYCLEEAEEELIEFSPEYQSYFEQNADVYDSLLTNLDEEVLRDIQSIPAKQRVLVTAHDAFGYFGKKYGIEVIGLQGISTLSEYGLNEITSLTKVLIARKIKSVFVETSVSDKALQSVIEGCKQQGHQIKIGGSLYSDALGPADTPEGTYIGMFRANVKLIKDGLR